jgi:hypothetical protein
LHDSGFRDTIFSMGKQDINLPGGVVKGRVTLNSCVVKFSILYPEREEVIVDPEGDVGMLTIYDDGFGQNSTCSIVLGPKDTQIMNKAQRLREKYIKHLLQDPNNTVPIVDGT